MNSHHRLPRRWHLTQSPLIGKRYNLTSQKRERFSDQGKSVKMLITAHRVLVAILKPVIPTNADYI